METTENTLDLKEVSTEDLRQELELRGYQMDNLWQSADVMDIYDCDSEVAMKILIKALNNSPFNLRPGNPSVNRSIGSGFDPNVDDAGYETDQSEGLEEFASQQGGQIRTSSYLSDKELSTWENKAFGGLF